jgi:hypothetical protein
LLLLKLLTLLLEGFLLISAGLAEIVTLDPATGPEKEKSEPASAGTPQWP